MGDFNQCQIHRTGVFRSLSMPLFGVSYHSSVLLMPTYKPVCKKQEHAQKIVRCWTEESIATLQACFDLTDWNVFYSSCRDLNKLTSTVSSYISFCVDSNIPCKEITIFPNNKPWVTKEVKSLGDRPQSKFNEALVSFCVRGLSRIQRQSLE